MIFMRDFMICPGSDHPPALDHRSRQEFSPNGIRSGISPGHLSCAGRAAGTSAESFLYDRIHLPQQVHTTADPVGEDKFRKGEILLQDHRDSRREMTLTPAKKRSLARSSPQKMYGRRKTSPAPHSRESRLACPKRSPILPADQKSQLLSNLRRLMLPVQPSRKKLCARPKAPLTAGSGSAPGRRGRCRSR